MKKPKYISDIYTFIFSMLGVCFFISAFLSYTNIIEVAKHSSIQDPRFVALSHFLLAIIFFIIQGVSRYLSNQNSLLHRELIESNIKVSATVERVKHRKDIHFGSKSPYVISYTYSYNGEKCNGKSHLLWDKASLVSTSNIDVYVDDQGRSVLDL